MHTAISTDYGKRENMHITLNEDSEVVAAVKEGLVRTGGYCPCRMKRTPEYKCMCEEFRNQIKDPEFEGYCHCMLYYKHKD
jgi:ferredoxin-thioredoxin reductase catalytic subunit